MNMIFSPHLYEYNLRGRIKGLIIWFLSAACTLAFLVLFFTLIMKSGIPDFVGEMVTALPRSLTQNFYIDALPNFSNYNVNLGICLQVVMIIGSVYSCYIGISSIITSRNDGTIVFGYSQGLSKICIIITHYLSSATVIALFNASVLCLSMWIGLSNNVPELLNIILKSFLTMFIVELLFLAIGMLISTFIRDISSCASMALGLFLLTFALGTLANYMSIFSFLIFLSPYHYFSPYMFSTIGIQLSIPKVVLSFIIIIVCVFLTHFRLLKHDLITHQV